MKNEDGFLEEVKLDEDLLDFEFDDLPAESIAGADGDSIPEEEVIDLVDVVEEGNTAGELETDAGLEDLTITPDEENPTGGEKPEDTSGDFTLTMEPNDFIDDINKDTSDLSFEIESEADSIDDLESLTEPDLELDLDGSDLESLAHEEADLELEDLVGPDESEDTGESDRQVDVPEPVAGAPGKDAPAGEPRLEFSQEGIEAAIREVVEEVVERVARETMADVAERVIREAIDALKDSLESPSE